VAKAQSKMNRRDEQRARQRQVEVSRTQANRRRLVKRIGAVMAAAVVVLAAFGYAFHQNGNGAGSAVAAGLGSPSTTTPVSPVGDFKPVGNVLRQGGKPEMFFAGALYCPHCAVERWAIVKALQGFGSFSGQRSTTNGDGVPTFDLTHATYHSRYVAFVARDIQDQQYHPLQSLTGQQQALFNRYDSTGSIPLVLVGGYAMSGSPIDSSEAQGRSFTNVQQALRQGKHDNFVHDVNDESTVITGLLCHADGMQPASTCNRGPVRSVVRELHG